MGLSFTNVYCTPYTSGRGTKLHDIIQVGIYDRRIYIVGIVYLRYDVLIFIFYYLCWRSINLVCCHDLKTNIGNIVYRQQGQKVRISCICDVYDKQLIGNSLQVGRYSGLCKGTFFADSILLGTANFTELCTNLNLFRSKNCT